MMFVEKEFPEAFKQISDDNLQPEKIDCEISYEYYFRYFKEYFTMALDNQEQTSAESVDS